MSIPTLKTGAADLAPEIAARAAERLDAAGAMVLAGLFPPDDIAALRAAYDARHGALDPDGGRTGTKDVGDRRLMIPLDIAGPFADPALFAHPVVRAVTAALLGDDIVMGSCVAVTSYPGAADQTMHFDQAALFGDPAIDAAAPPHSITLVVPLVDLDDATGGTRFVPGSHRAPDSAADAVTPDLRAGDGLLFDSRILHGGLANRSGAPRPILYFTYHRAWYRDVTNFRDMPAMRIDRAALDALPEAFRGWFAWAVRD